ncbi:hypothetical protein THRCLA_20946 [Thraustotheca clavata]|uniref:Secreted protein n=1 Tax=Thraustotheca clavata TaxID=74557 RepID=A0A1W0A1W4_9STRA|nr:hypothetical protein THRCLA_20946 [Thraustotheca clavata]
MLRYALYLLLFIAVHLNAYPSSTANISDTIVISTVSVPSLTPTAAPPTDAPSATSTPATASPTSASNSPPQNTSSSSATSTPTPFPPTKSPSQVSPPPTATQSLPPPSTKQTAWTNDITPEEKGRQYKPQVMTPPSSDNAVILGAVLGSTSILCAVGSFWLWRRYKIRELEATRTQFLDDKKNDSTDYSQVTEMEF